MGAPSLVVMGVSGCGKSTLGAELAQRMAAGVALTDDDRKGWLETIAHVLREANEQARPVVVSCSALKRSYRDVLRSGDAHLRLVYLHGDPALLAAYRDRLRIATQ